MKAVAFISETEVIVKMTVSEVIKLTGFGHTSDFDKKFGVRTQYGSDVASSHRDAFIEMADFPVATMYDQAKETLSDYKELKTKMESIRNQLTTLTNKMEKMQPPKKEKK